MEEISSQVYFHSIYRFRPDIWTIGYFQQLFSVCSICSLKQPKDQVWVNFLVLLLRVCFIMVFVVIFAYDGPIVTILEIAKVSFRVILVAIFYFYAAFFLLFLVSFAISILFIVIPSYL